MWQDFKNGVEDLQCEDLCWELKEVHRIHTRKGSKEGRFLCPGPPKTAHWEFRFQYRRSATCIHKSCTINATYSFVTVGIL